MYIISYAQIHWTNQCLSAVKCYIRIYLICFSNNMRWIGWMMIMTNKNAMKCYIKMTSVIEWAGWHGRVGIVSFGWFHGGVVSRHVKLPWIFPGAPLTVKVSGASRNIRETLTCMGKVWCCHGWFQSNMFLHISGVMALLEYTPSSTAKSLL